MLERTLWKLRDEPVLFVEEILKATPDPWQAEMLNALKTHGRVAVRSGHGVGKSCAQSWAALWFMFTRPYSKIICTAPTLHQLHDILWSELSKWLKRSELLSEFFEYTKTKIFFKQAAAEWFAVARTAARPENLAGFHADNLLFILDEASGIDEAIFETVLGALTGAENKLLMCSNPTRNSGFFKRAFFEEREQYHVMKISSLESHRVSVEYAQKLIKAYGEDSDVVRVRVLGEFPTGESDTLISLEHIESAMEREKTYSGDLIFGADIARQGSDFTAIATRIGNDLIRLDKWKSADLMTTVGKILSIISSQMKKFNKSKAQIRIDDDGLGAGVTDRLREVFREKGLKITVFACHNGGKSRDPRFVNFVTESYFALRDRLQNGEITLISDDQLAAELSTRKFSLTSSDKLILERKEEFKKRIKRSPDSADAVALAFAPLQKNISFPSTFSLAKSYWL